MRNLVLVVIRHEGTVFAPCLTTEHDRSYLYVYEDPDPGSEVPDNCFYWVGAESFAANWADPALPPEWKRASTEDWQKLGNSRPYHHLVLYTDE